MGVEEEEVGEGWAGGGEGGQRKSSRRGTRLSVMKGRGTSPAVITASHTPTIACSCSPASSPMRGRKRVRSGVAWSG